MNWSPEQSAIFSAFANGTGNLIVQARAGTGKTTTIKEAFNHAPEARILYAVFNKKNQKEAEAKIQDHRVEVKTLHSLGYYFIKRVWRNAKPDDEVETDRVMDVVGRGCQDREYIGAVLKLVGFAKNSFINPSEADLAKIIDAQDISANGISDREICGAALLILSASKQPDAQGRISFNDMVWLPVAMAWVKPIYNLVCIDEAQDMNMPQLTMARQASSGRVVVVGDDRQAIYGFRGAAQDGMGMMKVTLRASVCTLSTTYRCPKAVVKVASELVPDYKAADSAPEGVVSSCSDVLKVAKVGDAILSRLNAPLMPLALQLIRANIPARIEGRDIGRQLVGMVKSMKAKSVPHFIERVEGWLAKQIERLEKSKNAEKKIEQTRDIAETLKALAMDAKSVQDIEDRIVSLFKDSLDSAEAKNFVVLSSVHKAKGLEWPRVFLLTETFRKGKGQEEDNIYYVAVTRAMKELYFAGGQVAESATSIYEKPNKSQDLTRRSERIAELSAKGKTPSEILETIRVEYPPAKTEQVKIFVRGEGDEVEVPGQKKYAVGDVIIDDGDECVCYKVNDCNARFVCTTRSERSGETLGGKRFNFLDSARRFSTCNSYEGDKVVAKIPESEVQNFLSRKSAKAQKETNNETKAEENEDNNMTKKANKTNKTAAPKVAKEKSGTPKSYSGRGERIAELVAAKKTDNQIMETIKAEFPGSSPSVVLKTIASKRAKGAKAKESPKAAKKETKAPGKPAKKKVATKIPEAAPEAAPTEAEESKPAAALPPRPAATAQE